MRIRLSSGGYYRISPLLAEPVLATCPGETEKASRVSVTCPFLKKSVCVCVHCASPHGRSEAYKKIKIIAKVNHSAV